MVKIKLGMIGYNEENGHPYSFSAIINGYNEAAMKKSLYPQIFNYLDARKKSDFDIYDAEITHVWTPFDEVSKEISKCCLIKNIVSNYEDMVDHVDGVIIARDDVESHLKISEFFLTKNISVFIDKPLCSTIKELKYFIPFLKNGLLMSCSGLRYFPKTLSLSLDEEFKSTIISSSSFSFKDWKKYGIHVIEAVFPVMGYEIDWVQNIGEENNNIVRIQYKSKKFSIIQLNEKSSFELSTFFLTNKDNTLLHYNDNFSCFKSLMKEFIKQVRTKKPSINPNETINAISSLIASEISKKTNGKKVFISDLLK